ncbi:MAG: 30S ribosomal protein S11 [Bacteroidota bacterium]
MAISNTKKKNSSVDHQGVVYIKASFNNIIISIANQNGQVIAWSSAGKMKFKGSKKQTPYAAQIAAINCAKTAYERGMKKVKVYVKGPGKGRESAIRAINETGLAVLEIRDITPIPHGGCRPRKVRKK